MEVSHRKSLRETPPHFRLLMRERPCGHVSNGNLRHDDAVLIRSLFESESTAPSEMLPRSNDCWLLATHVDFVQHARTPRFQEALAISGF